MRGAAAELITAQVLIECSDWLRFVPVVANRVTFFAR